MKAWKQKDKDFVELKGHVLPAVKAFEGMETLLTDTLVTFNMIVTSGEGF